MKMQFGIAYEFDPYFGLSISRVDLSSAKTACDKSFGPCNIVRL